MLVGYERFFPSTISHGGSQSIQWASYRFIAHRDCFPTRLADQLGPIRQTK